MRSYIVAVIFVMGNGIVAMRWQSTAAGTTSTALGHGLGLGPHGARGWDEGPGPKSRGCVGTSLGVGEVASGKEGGGCELMDHFGHGACLCNDWDGSNRWYCDAGVFWLCVEMELRINGRSLSAQMHALC